MLKLSKGLFTSCILAFLFLFCEATYAKETGVVFKDSKQNTIEIYKKNELVRVSHSNKRVTPENKLTKLLTEVSSMAVISDKTFEVGSSEYFWAFIRIPSKRNFGNGLCGAGFEDYLTLFMLDRRHLIFIDRFKAQSCLDNIYIDVDEMEDLNEKISLLPNLNSLEFSQRKIKNGVESKKSILLTPLPKKIGIKSAPNPAPQNY